MGGVGLSGIFAAGTMAPFIGNAVGVRSDTLGEGAGQSGWKNTAGAGHSSMRAGSVRGLAVTLKKM